MQHGVQQVPLVLGTVGAQPCLHFLGDHFQEFKESSSINNQYPVLTSSNKGLMLQSVYYGENRITDRNNQGFNIIPSGYITYRSRSDDGLFTFNLNSLGFTGIVSTYYPVFNFVNGDNRFFTEYLNFYQLTLTKFSVGTSQKVLSLNSIQQIYLKIPGFQEQTKIADFLSALDEKIRLVKLKIEKMELWKKGLLQKMFC